MVYAQAMVEAVAMSDYTDLCARLRHNCECDSETMYQCDSCTASYAIESQAREIAELKAKLDKFKWRFEEWERKGYLALADERDAALRKVEELRGLLRGLLREVVEVVAACHNCLSYEAPELADRVDAALGEKR